MKPPRRRTDDPQVNRWFILGLAALIVFALITSFVFNFVLDESPIDNSGPAAGVSVTAEYAYRQGRPTHFRVQVNTVVRRRVDHAGDGTVRLRCLTVGGDDLGSYPVDHWPQPARAFDDRRAAFNVKLPAARMSAADRCELLDSRGRVQASAAVY